MSLDAPFDGTAHLEPARPKAWTVPPAGPLGPRSPDTMRTAGDMPTPLVPLDRIVVGDRIRKDMGDLDSLAASIRARGLLNPLTVDGDFRLLAGQRRLAAVRMLGFDRVEVRVAVSVHDALAAAQVERDENVERKAFTPEEAVRAGSLIEELERPKAEERKAEGRQRGTAAKGRSLGGKLPPSDGPDTSEAVAPTAATTPATSPPPAPKTRDAAAAAVGMSGRTYEKAKAVVKAAQDPALPVEAKAEAKAALEEMNRTGKVDPAFKKVTRAAGWAGAVAAYPFLADVPERDRARFTSAAEQLQSMDAREQEKREPALRASARAACARTQHDDEAERLELAAERAVSDLHGALAALPVLLDDAARRWDDHPPAGLLLNRMPDLVSKAEAALADFTQRVGRTHLRSVK